MSFREYTRTATSAVLAVDQVLAAASPDIVGHDGRVEITIQNCQHDSDVYVGVDTTVATTGVILRRGTALNDGNGGSITIRGYTGPIWLWESAGTGAVVRYLETGQ